jgi:hypothetical protein
MHEYLVMQLSMQEHDLDIQMVDAPIAFNFSTFPLVLGHNQRSQKDVGRPKRPKKLHFFVTFVYVVSFECHDNYGK